MEKVLDGVRRIVPELSKDKGTDAAWAIMTTDTVRKEVAYEMELSGGTVRIGAMAKGSGMIHPNMATMLAYITTDAKVDASVLQGMLKKSTDKSFNMMTVDGDTSTNDSPVPAGQRRFRRGHRDGGRTRPPLPSCWTASAWTWPCASPLTARAPPT